MQAFCKATCSRVVRSICWRTRGFVDVARGADIDISGTSSAIDVPGTGVAGGFQRRQIASAAGSITLRAPESLSFQGTLHAQAGAGDTPVAGGTATYQLTRQRGFERVAAPRYIPDLAAHAAGDPRFRRSHGRAERCRRSGCGPAPRRRHRCLEPRGRQSNRVLWRRGSQPRAQPADCRADHRRVRRLGESGRALRFVRHDAGHLGHCGNTADFRHSGA